MPHLTRRGARIHGALITFLYPRLARDAKPPDLVQILAGAPRTNRITQRAGIATAIRATSRLAMDADVDDLPELLEALTRVAAKEEGEDPDDDGAIDLVDEDLDDEDLVDRIREFCRRRMRPEDCAELEHLLGAGDRRARARDDRDDLPRPGGDPATSRTSLANLEHHEVDAGGSVARDRRRRARDMTPARGARAMTHDALPPGIASAEERFPNAARARPFEPTWPAPSPRAQRLLAYDAAAHDAVPASVKPAEQRFPIASRVRPAGAA